MSNELSALDNHKQPDTFTKPRIDAVMKNEVFYLSVLIVGLVTCVSIVVWQLHNKQRVSSQLSIRPSARLRAADHAGDGKYHLLLCATGSVATIKIPNIVEALSHHERLSLRLVFTRSALEFLQSQSNEQPSISSLAKIKNVDGIYFDEDEWSKPWVRGDNILHIELRRWADMMVIVPLSANSLAKLAMGFSDNLILSVARAWDTSATIDPPRTGVRNPNNNGKRKAILVAPAMNTAMWEHPVTAKHIAVLEGEWSVGNEGWVEVLRPQEKNLACGDTGSGAMKDWKDIVGLIEMRFLT